MRAASLMRVRRLVRRLRRRLAAHRDMQLLLRADERVLRDVGLTRGDAQAAAASTCMACAAALRRNEAMRAASRRNARAACYSAASG